MTEQDLQAIKMLLEQELEPVKADIREMKVGMTGIKTDIAKLQESQEEVRDAVNALLEWSDKVSESFQFPLPRL